MTVVTKPSIRVISTRSTYAVTHLSLDGETPMCGQHAYRPFVVRLRAKATCKPCADLVGQLRRQLK